ncbi:hypothetical protein GGQ54_000948 [Naumannella cuiyingiana]|uniref:Uncharacterized protein n=1 Tax=Naumannella cuiyingiana TaxID=1347891 RepID=A0A7Z0D7L9_9ACTN|nr:hypothetical protein [Naumannella cuiyingiana]
MRTCITHTGDRRSTLVPDPPQPKSSYAGPAQAGRARRAPGRSSLSRPPPSEPDAGRARREPPPIAEIDHSPRFRPPHHAQARPNPDQWSLSAPGFDGARSRRREISTAGGLGGARARPRPTPVELVETPAERQNRPLARVLATTPRPNPPEPRPVVTFGARFRRLEVSTARGFGGGRSRRREISTARGLGGARSSLSRPPPSAKTDHSPGFRPPPGAQTRPNPDQWSLSARGLSGGRSRRREVSRSRPREISTALVPRLLEQRSTT